MANRYWVGGSGTWSTTNTTNWSTTSGGAGGASVPTSSDDVYFDSNSGSLSFCGLLDFPTCNNLSIAIVFAFTNAGSNGVIQIFGSLNCTVLLGGIPTQFLSTNTGNTITTTGTPISGYFNGVGGEWTLQDNIDAGEFLTLNAGSLNTNDKTVNCIGFFTSGSDPKTITLGSSIVNVSWNTVYGTTAFDLSASNLTFNCGTSTINFLVSSNTIPIYTNLFNFSNFIYNNVTFTPVSAAPLIQPFELKGDVTFNNLTFNANSIPGYTAYTISRFNSSITVTGTFTSAGLNGNQRVAIYGNFFTQKTITANAVSLTDTSFQSIAATGLATWSGTRISNSFSGFGNSGITFSTPKTVYWSFSAGGDYMSSNGWATTSGGTPATTNFPMAQDTVIVNDSSVASGASFAVSSAIEFGAGIDFSARTLPMTVNIGSGYTSNGSMSFSSTLSVSGTGGFTLANQSTTIYNTITSNGFVFNNPVTAYTGYNLPQGVFQLADNFVSTSSFNQYGSSVLCNDHNLTCNAFLQASPSFYYGASTLLLGTGQLSITGNNTTVFSGGNITGNSGNPIINLTYTGSVGTRTISSGSLTLNLNIPSGSDTVDVSGTFNDLDFTGFSGVLLNSGITVSSNVVFPATMTTSTSSSGVLLFKLVSGSKNINTNGVVLNFPVAVFSDYLTGSAGTWYLQSDLVIGQSNTLNLTGGNFYANNYNITCGSVISTQAYGNGIWRVYMGSGTWTLTGTGTVFDLDPHLFSTNVFNADTSSIIVTDATSATKTFVGRNKIYHNLTMGAGTATATYVITGANTFNSLSNAGSNTQTFVFDSASLTTITSWGIFGSAGHLVTIQPSSSVTWNVNKTNSNTVIANYLNVVKSTATPSSTFYAINSTDGGGNSGWTFGAPPSSNNTFFLV